MRRIGVLMSFAESDAEAQAYVAAFRDGLQKLGWTEGRNIRIDYRFGAANVEAMQQLAKEIVALQPDLILSQSTVTTASLLQLTRAIPIIFASVSDAVGAGFVASLARPGGNVTGFTSVEYGISGKSLELLKQIAPGVTLFSDRCVRAYCNIFGTNPAGGEAAARRTPLPLMSQKPRTRGVFCYFLPIMRFHPGASSIVYLRVFMSESLHCGRV
jgi:hypothetical protein